MLHRARVVILYKVDGNAVRRKIASVPGFQKKTTFVTEARRFDDDRTGEWRCVKSELHIRVDCNLLCKMLARGSYPSRCVHATLMFPTVLPRRQTARNREALAQYWHEGRHNQLFRTDAPEYCAYPLPAVIVPPDRPEATLPAPPDETTLDTMSVSDRVQPDVKR